MGTSADRPNDAATDRLVRARRVNAACDRFEAAWAAGRAPRIEEFQGDVDGRGWPPLLRELLLMELELRRGRGERPGPEEYRTRFPRHAPLVEAAFSAPAEASGRSFSGHVLETLALTVGEAPRVLLRDTETSGNHAPVVQPSSSEMPAPADRSCRLQLFGEMARGGMGAVLKGRDADLGRELAVKVLLEAHSGKPDLVRRFVEEAQISGQLQHPGIVPVYELGVFDDARPYFSMKLVKGRTLAELLHERPDPASDLPRFLSIFEAVSQTMAYAHARGVIHRDLKPSNVMVGSFGEVQVMDWGLAKVLSHGGVVDDATAGKLENHETVIATSRRDGDSDLSQAGSIMGTPAYMAPEQARGETDRLDERADVFALGAILCELLTGHPAFLGRGTAEIQRKAAGADLADTFARLDSSGAHPELVALARGCLAAQAGDRPRDAGAVTERVGAYLAGVQERLRAAELAGAEARAREAEERKRRRLTGALAASILITMAVGGGGWAYLAKQRIARRAATAGLVNQALDRATLLRGQARSASDDLARWTEAVAAADNAAAVLAAGESEPALRGRVAALRHGLARDLAEAKARAERAERDRRLMARLEEVRGDREPFYGEAGGARAEADSAADAAYAAAFHESGFDPNASEPREVGQRVSTRPKDVVAAVTVALDTWASIRRQRTTPDAEGSARRLLAAARAADPDPWRNALRDAIERKDLKAYRRLADDPALTDQPPSSLWLLGKSLGDLGEQVLATATLRRAQQRYPGDYWLNYELGVTLAGYHLYEKGLAKTLMDAEAVRFLTAARALRPLSASVNIELGFNLALHSPQRLDEAVALCREGARLRPDYPNAHTHLAWGLQRQGKLDEAIAERREAVRLKPDWAGAHHTLGDALVAAGRREEAALAYKEVTRLLQETVRLRPGDAAAHYRLGDFLWAQGDVSTGFAELREAIRLQPDDALARVKFANRLTEIGRGDEAVVELREASRLSPDSEIIRFHLSKALILKGKRDEALDAYRKAIQANPDDVEARLNFGRSLYQTGSLETSIDVLNELVQLHPELPEAYINLAAARIRKGDVNGSLAELQRARRLKPYTPRDPARLAYVLENLGYLLNGQGRYREAAAALRDAVELKPDYPNAHDNLGTAYLKQGRYEEAIPAYREALRLQPNYPETRPNLVFCLSKLEKSDEALAECREAIRLKPDDFEAHLQLGLLLESQGDWEGAVTTLRSLKTEAGTPFASRVERALRDAARKVALAPRLPAVLRGSDRPANAAERLEFAQMAYETKRFSSSARLLGEALRDDPGLAADRQAQHRYNAACSAALAGCGKGKDDPPPDDAERARLRRQALDWLNAERAVWSKALDAVDRPARENAVEGLTDWTRDLDLSGVRDPDALERRADPERTDWRALWSEVDRLLEKARADSR